MSRSARTGNDDSDSVVLCRLGKLTHKIRRPVRADHSFNNLDPEIFEDIDSLRHDIKIAGRTHDDSYFHMLKLIVFHSYLTTCKDNQKTNTNNDDNTF